ncbi:cystatin-9-like [Urocitellus parryii]|uniref:cystatin-9-like n=1 Tax=Urocitellus parryii TaxID=9999 RepID=UPI000E558941|nr:cystatin-9-like [Urocitellus parryii]
MGRELEEVAKEGFHPLVTQAWCSEKDMYTLQLQIGDPNFSPTLEFALQKFNQQNKDQYAYKLVQVLSSETKKMSISTIYSMTLELGRTVCGKSEGDINDCPLQDSPEQNHVSESTSLPHFTDVGAPWAWSGV